MHILYVTDIMYVTDITYLWKKGIWGMVVWWDGKREVGEASNTEDKLA